jgi:hypothetical protein
VRGVVFDLDETLLDRRGSLDTYARLLHSDFSVAATLGPDRFLEEFRIVDDNGRAPREQFAQGLARRCFDGVNAADIAAHSKKTLGALHDSSTALWKCYYC